MGPLAGNTSSHQPWARAVDLRTAARAGQIMRNYLLLYENIPAYSSFSRHILSHLNNYSTRIFLHRIRSLGISRHTSTFTVIITSYHQPWARAVYLRAAASPHIIVLIGASTGIFLHTAFLVTPQHLQHEKITAQNSFTRHILSHLRS